MFISLFLVPNTVPGTNQEVPKKYLLHKRKMDCLPVPCNPAPRPSLPRARPSPPAS